MTLSIPRGRKNQIATPPLQYENIRFFILILSLTLSLCVKHDPLDSERHKNHIATAPLSMYISDFTF